MFTFGIAVADYVVNVETFVRFSELWRRLLDEFGRATFFFIETEVSAQYLQCLCSCFNLIQPE